MADRITAGGARALDAPADDAPDTPAIQTVRRAATILSAFTVERPTLSLNEITQCLGTSRPTAHRYARALRAANLLRYDPERATYTLGPQVLALEAAARAGLPIAATAQPHLEALVRRLDQTAVLSVWNGESAVVVSCADTTSGAVQISVRTGSQLDLLRSAQGRVFCAHLPVAEVPGLARRLRSSPELRALLAEIRETGIAENIPAETGVRVLAAPVFEGGQVVAAMAVMGTTVSLTDASRRGAAEALLKTTRALSTELGTTP
jgi:DNA-binding IclR family transcriptional regulator